ncbi:S9 family peptidase [Geodermatophilus sp. TF02-6]|uniref:S9 family peptidase n=1 Tax=Geodermatophilus sp. TF02-6 TaxID=2250575 RepID=UPI000DE840C4|nr:prolyl oligopeptidase family serine peptidase [Geodermatophilus sp. TF02-6]RBY83033.1 S9 family peptidase [Geodermatophilus sp. TF02-6]
MRAEDIELLRTPGVPAVSPDGRMAVVAVARPDLDGDRFRSQLWAVPTDGSAPARALTSGARDRAPAFSPDGRWLAYLGAEPGEPPQICLLPTAGGAPRRLTASPLGAGAPVWAPDSRRLAYTARVPAGDPGAPRLVTTLRYRRDGAGPRCVFVLDLPPDGEDDGAPLPQPRQLTDGPADDTDVTWRPDGAELAFVSARHPRADCDLVRDVHAVPAAGGTPRRVTDGRARCALPAYDPSGAWIHLTARPDLGPEGRDVADSGATLCRVPAAGGAVEPVLDPGSTDRGDETPATVLAAGAAHLGVRRRGGVELLRVPLDGGPPQALVDGPFTVRGVAVGGGVVVATVAHDRSAGELIAITPGRRRLLTGFGRALGATGRLHRARELLATASDGSPVHGWVTVPDGPGPHPVLLLVPGGPHRPEGWSLSEDTQVLVSAGHAVVRCDPRGAAGPRDADDAVALLDAALADPALDAHRVGVQGGSLAALLVGRTARFAAAVCEDGPADPAASDVGCCVDRHPDPERPAAPIATPTLVVHREQDSSCPGEQGLRLYGELKRRGVPSELLLFPGEGGRPGRPRHRLARLEHLLRWWARWLPTAPCPDGPPDEDAAGAPPPGGGGRAAVPVRAARPD